MGGSQAMQQQQFLVRGIGGGNNTVTFDGMNLNSLLGDGSTVPYFNDATAEEFSFQAGGLDADTTAGGGRAERHSEGRREPVQRFGVHGL